jgi:hypothetical protein
LKRYQSFIEQGDLDKADRYVCENIDQIGHAKALWHLWRFQRFDGLEPVRRDLFSRFLFGERLLKPALELLYYLQEQRCVGEPKFDRALQCPEIFGALCREAAAAGRADALAMNLIFVGELETENALDLPAVGDSDVVEKLGELSNLERRLLEGARCNRCAERPLALGIVDGSEANWTTDIPRERTLELYIGPYFFQEPPKGPHTSGRIASRFRSPFRPGLLMLSEFFLRRGWRIVPFLSWRGGFAPRCNAFGKWSLTYHTHGRRPGLWHYKFGHFSDIMQVDPFGYAGFSRFAERSAEDVWKDTHALTDVEIEAGLASFRRRYIDERFTWREQPQPEDLSAFRGRRTFFFPLQDPLDEVAALSYLEPADVVEALREALDSVDRVFVKRHPVDTTEKTSALLATLSHDERFIISDASVHDLFGASDAVVTVNSGVGFEALLAGLPVIAAGLSDYNLAAVTARTRAELTAALIDLAAVPDREWRSRVVYHYFHYFALDPRRPDQFRERLARIFGFGESSRPGPAPDHDR